MARRTRKNADDKTTDMFKKKKKETSSGHGQKRTDLTPKQIQATIPKKKGPRPKLYAGLDSEELAKKLKALAQKHGATFFPVVWNGTSEISLNGSLAKLTKCFKAFADMGIKYDAKLRITTSIRPDDVNKMLIVAPGPLIVDN